MIVGFLREGKFVAPPGAHRGRDIVVVGASAGGVEALSQIVAQLPANLTAAVFVVLHIAPSGTSVLPSILTRRGQLPAVHAVDGDAIEPGRIYVAPPDHHLLVEPDAIRVVRGPKENGYRPAIDPLFRTAARTFGGRVVGVILSGVLDDGTAGLNTVKEHGGRTLVQHPEDALYGGMPESAIEFVGPDRVLPASELGAAIVEYTREDAPPAAVAHNPGPPQDQLLEDSFERVDRGASDSPQPGVSSGFTCPDCGGGLWEAYEGEATVFRCRTGHAFGSDALLASQSSVVEAAMWAAIRALEERAAMTRRMAGRFRARGRRVTAERFERQANAAVEQAVTIRRALGEVMSDLTPRAADEIQ
jgi:two-component system, chemotaxis family, protein-glutamate methylesterase/glutaminase